MSMKCDKCGNSLVGNEKFCGSCGNQINVNQNFSSESADLVKPANGFMNSNFSQDNVVPSNDGQSSSINDEQFTNSQVFITGNSLNNKTNSFSDDKVSNNQVMNSFDTNQFSQPFNNSQVLVNEKWPNNQNQIEQFQNEMYAYPMNNQMYNINQQPKKNNTGLVIILILLIIAVLGAGGFTVYYFMQSDDTEEVGDKKDDDRVDVELGGETIKVPKEYQVKDYNNGIIISSDDWKIYLEVQNIKYSNLDIETIKTNLTNSSHIIYSYEEKDIDGSDYMVFDLVYKSAYRKYMYGSYFSNKVVAVEIISSSASQKPDSSLEEVVHEIITSK